MENFLYDIPTKVYFGKGQISHLATCIKEYGSKVLLVYGGGSIKRIGLYDELITILKNNHLEWVELSGVEPNPRIESVNKGVELCRMHHIDVVLAVGGGSSIDCAKVIAASVDYQGDAWELVKDKTKIKHVLPIISILTLSATGSEMDHGAVISNLNTHEKVGVGHPDMAPRYSILDPTYTYSVNAYQSAAGTADIMSHIFEEYFKSNSGTYMLDRIAECLLKTCIKYGPIVLKDPNNYEARENLMWAGSWAINGLLKNGKSGVWSVHPIEHELSAYYDITHGVGLAILTPHWMQHVLNDTTLNKFVEYGVNVWKVDPNLDPYEIANQAIKATQSFFISLGLPSTLSQLGIDQTNFIAMAKSGSKSLANAYVPLDEHDVLKIYQASL
ncbi:MAG: iron-containing alcohol dehydrogenase [Erysipelotrichaceae bacterium]